MNALLLAATTCILFVLHFPGWLEEYKCVCGTTFKVRTHARKYVPGVVQLGRCCHQFHDHHVAVRAEIPFVTVTTKSIIRRIVMDLDA